MRGWKAVVDEVELDLQAGQRPLEVEAALRQHLLEHVEALAHLLAVALALLARVAGPRRRHPCRPPGPVVADLWDPPHRVQPREASPTSRAARRARSGVLSAPPPYPAGVRLLHTSDWHLGRSFHRVGLLDAQAAFLDHLVEVVRAEQVDVVLVAGDVYDRAMPAVDTVALLYEARHPADRRRCAGGALQRQPRLGAPARLRPPAAGARPGCTSAPRLEGVGAPVLLDDDRGLPPALPRAVAGRRRPRSARPSAPTPASCGRRWSGSAPTSPRRPRHRSVVMAARLRRRRRDQRLRARHQRRRRRRRAPRRLRRRRLRRPGPPARPPALSETVRYSGSPLALSFSEADHPKGSWLVDLGRAGARRREPVEAPVAPPARRAARARSTTCSPTRPTRDGGVGVVPGDAHRRRSGRSAPWSGSEQRFPHTLVLQFEDAACRSARTPTPRGSASAATSTSAATSSSTCGRAPAPAEQERAVLAEALEGSRQGRAVREDEGQADRPVARRPAVGRVRLHRLQVTAFGPFAGTEEVDFDELAAAGLFLLHGPTGAGKTSVLDAVCFALYAEVPGARAESRRSLRSDHAAGRRGARGGARAHRRGPPAADHPLPGVRAPQAARHRHHQRPGQGGPRGAASAASGCRAPPATTRRRW